MQSWVGLLESLALTSKPHTGQPVGMLHLQQYTAEGDLTFFFFPSYTLMNSGRRRKTIRFLEWSLSGSLKSQKFFEITENILEHI